jgi:hypothetical protein
MHRRNRVFEKAIGVGLIALVIFSQKPELYAGPGATAPVQQENQRKLNIVIIQGEGAINNVKQRLAREVIVQVTDENNRPVGGGVVAFILPVSGPGGVFSNGTTVINVTTNAAGRAAAQFTPNTLSGTFQVNVAASFQGQVSTAVIPQTNALTATSSTAASGVTASVGTGTGISGTTIAIIAAAVAGAVAAGVVAGGKGNDGPSPAPRAPTVSIGVAGTPTLGTPGLQRSVSITVFPRW